MFWYLSIFGLRGKGKTLENAQRQHQQRCCACFMLDRSAIRAHGEQTFCSENTLSSETDQSHYTDLLPQPHNAPLALSSQGHTRTYTHTHTRTHAHTLSLHTFPEPNEKKGDNICHLADVCNFRQICRCTADIALGRAACVEVIVTLLVKPLNCFSSLCFGGENLDHI